ncbi:anthranilate phosphoribosyltransferase [Enterococcus gilvus]|uniref:anthranilate phosphoribosyltransferase n=1 Tax=Enterococcus gilvus TaxID=160453 RepID=UPI00345E82B4
MQELFEKVYRGNDLSIREMQQVGKAIFDRQLTDSQISGLLVGLKVKGVAAAELTGLAQVMQGKGTPMMAAPSGVMDNCGTGGDHSHSFNISTTAAFVLAGGGIPMAKHGNRSISSKSGSADVLEALGISLTVSPGKIDYLLKETGIAFLFAPNLHPAMGAVMHIRKELATPTIFNLLGPIINPYPLEHQLMGTYAGEALMETAKTLGQLGRKRAIVVHGHGGMDEANLAGATHCALYQNGAVEEFSFDPEEVGFQRVPLEGIVGGSVDRNKDILLSVLRGVPSAYYETVLLNAGLGFLASGRVKTLVEGIKEAEQSILSGAAYDRLQQLIMKQQEVA